MSRYTITVTSDDRSDPPLRTFFLQAFPDESGNDLALWLGTSDREYETLDALQMPALSRGYCVMPLPEYIASQLVADLAKEARLLHDGPLAVSLRHLQSK